MLNTFKCISQQRILVVGTVFCAVFVIYIIYVMWFAGNNHIKFHSIHSKHLYSHHPSSKLGKSLYNELITLNESNYNINTEDLEDINYALWQDFTTRQSQNQNSIEFDKKKNKTLVATISNMKQSCKNVHIVGNPNFSNYSNFRCVNMSIVPVTPICVHDPEIDVYISRQIINDGIWEAHIVSKFQEILRKLDTKTVAFVDLGANIGMYSLIAAEMGYNVVAVEPYIENILRLKSAAHMAGNSKLITVLKNGVSDQAGQGYLVLNNDNQGDTRIEQYQSEKEKPQVVDLVPVWCIVPFVSQHNMIIKIDVQGYEHKAFSQLPQLLMLKTVPYIIMEWVMLREFYQTEDYKSENKQLTIMMIDMLYRFRYKAYSLISGKLLTKQYWYGWSEDVLWIHQSVVAY